MRRFTFVILLAVACGSPPSPAPPPATSEPPPQSHATAKSVTIKSPADREPIRSNPFVIRGTARTFENNVALRVLDSRGTELAQRPVTALGELGSFNPWSTEIYLTSMPHGAITIEAVDLSPKDGSVISRAWVTAPFEVEPRQVQLFFSSNRDEGDQCVDVLPVTRTLPKSISAARLLLEALIAGPTAEEAKAGYISPFPEWSGVRSVNLKDGVLAIDFNESLRNVGGACRVSAIRAGVEKTLKTLPGVERVEITAAGSRELALQP